MRVLPLLLLLALASDAQEFVSNVKFKNDSLEITLINYEVPRDKPYLIVHFEIRNPGDQDVRCDWMSLVTLLRQDGTSMSSNYDVLVDTGTGGTRATGPFLVPKRRKARASVLFVLSPDDLPGQLMLPDGRRSPRITFRGKVR